MNCPECGRFMKVMRLYMWFVNEDYLTHEIFGCENHDSPVVQVIDRNTYLLGDKAYAKP